MISSVYFFYEFFCMSYYPEGVKYTSPGLPSDIDLL